MKKLQLVTLFIGNDPDSDKAKKIVQDSGINLCVVYCGIGQCDFDLPLLVSPWGVFDGINSITWFGRVASEQSKLDDPIAGATPA